MGVRATPFPWRSINSLCLGEPELTLFGRAMFVAKGAAHPPNRHNRQQDSHKRAQTLSLSSYHQPLPLSSLFPAIRPSLLPHCLLLSFGYLHDLLMVRRAPPPATLGGSASTASVDAPPRDATRLRTLPPRLSPVRPIPLLLNHPSSLRSLARCSTLGRIINASLIDLP